MILKNYDGVEKITLRPDPALAMFTASCGYGISDCTPHSQLPISKVNEEANNKLISHNHLMACLKTVLVSNRVAGPNYDN